jgi:hypothetical protein
VLGVPVNLNSNRPAGNVDIEGTDRQLRFGDEPVLAE